MPITVHDCYGTWGLHAARDMTAFVASAVR
jgi:hypothetical protein